MYNGTVTIDKDKLDALEARLASIGGELDTAHEQRDNALTQLRYLKEGLQSDLADWAENNLDNTSDEYRELSEVMQSHGLAGLARDYDVTVRVTYEFTVTVVATDEDQAREEVDNDIYSHLSDNVDTTCYDDIDFEVSEA